MRERFYEIVDTRKTRSRYGAFQKVVSIKCPFCESVTEANVWSLAGSGKRCNSCTAVHHYHPQISVRADS